MDFSFDVTDHTVVAPVELALNPALMDVVEDFAAPEWPEHLPGTPA